MIYLWKAEQSEPGATGATYAITTSPESHPSAIEPTAATGAEGLAYAESFYGEWQLLGAVQGEAFVNGYGETVVIMRTPALDGTVVELADIDRHHWYRNVEASA